MLSISEAKKRAAQNFFKKTNTEDIVQVILDDLENSVELIDEFISALGSLDLRILEPQIVTRLLGTYNDSLITKLLNCDRIYIDWNREVGDGHHTLLHVLAHMNAGAFETKAIEIYEANKDDEKWLSINHDVVNGHVAELFGDWVG